MHSRLAALLNVSIHDALNSIPGSARFETYLPPVETTGPASPKAALAAAGRTMLKRYIDFFSDPSLPPPFHNPLLEDLRPQVESLHAAQLAAIPSGPAKAEGIRVGRKAARRLWNARLNDGWNNPSATLWVWPDDDDDGDDDPRTGPPGQYVRLASEDTYPGAEQPSFHWWGDVQPWAMTSNDQFLVDPPPSFDDPAHIADIEEVRAYAADDSAVRTAQQSFEAFWWEACPGVGFASTLTFARQLASDFGLNDYGTARMFALMGITQADAMISNVNSKNFYNFWRPFTAIEHYHPGGDWDPFLITPSNQEYPAGHPMVSGSGLYALAHLFGLGELSTPLLGTGGCGTIEYASLEDAIDGVINARVWGVCTSGDRPRWAPRRAGR